MCGIAGWAGIPAQQPALEAMLQALAPRGPDAHGLFIDNEAQIALGHRRLIILDPEGGAQPMRLAQTVITFNGEIYNFAELRTQLAQAGHLFTTRSDTEVLLHAYQHWGLDFAHRLEGQFACAIWDAAARRLILARDRFGEKPLFLAHHQGGLLFASELKALLPPTLAQIRPGAVDAFLTYRYIPGPQTFFQHIEKLPPAHLAVYQNKTLTRTRYWTPPDALPRHPAPPTDLLPLLDHAVQQRMVADVPFGAFLSGGLDSSAITALMARHTTTLETFAVGFAAPGYSELNDAALVAKHIGTHHHTTEVTAADYPALLPEATRARDAPVSEPSDIALLKLARLAATRVKMVLSGEGADELLGGYPKHRAERLSPLYCALIPTWARTNPLLHHLPRRIALALETMALPDEQQRFARWFGALTPTARQSLLTHPHPVQAPEIQGTTPLRRLFHFDQTSWLADNLLERGDRMTMAASLEARMPFLDTTLVTTISTWPDQARLGKRRLRQAMAPYLPAHTIARRKVGFQAPMDLWFRTNLHDWLHDHLTGPSCRTAPLYNPKTLAQILQQHRAGNTTHGKLLWSLLALEIFHREYRL